MPDKAHAEYFAKNPKGNHDIFASEETLKLLAQLKLEVVGMIDNHAKEDVEIHNQQWAEIRSKISISMFITVLSVLLSFISGMFYLIWNEIKIQNSEVNIIKVDSSTTKSDVSFIRGLLTNPETEITK